MPTAEDTAPFSATERDYLRRELGPIFGQVAQLSDGLILRTWHTGAKKGEPKVPKAAQGMLDRGLLEIRPGKYNQPRAFFTEAGLQAVRQLLLAKRRGFDPATHGHLWVELGLEPPRS